jgi:hypothetical protein
MIRSTLGLLVAFVGGAVAIVACGGSDADDKPENTGGTGNVSYYGGYGGSDGGYGGSDGGYGGGYGGSGGASGSGQGGAAGGAQGGAAGGGGLSPIDGTCENHCGDSMPPPGAKCYCDEDCIPIGDCCSDFDQFCSSAGGSGGGPSGGGGSGGGSGGGLPSCVGHCGTTGAVPGSNPACYCDDLCIDSGDCCFDFNVACAFVGGGGSGGGSNNPTCAGHCGKITPAPGSDPACYCDITCQALDDCCDDYDSLCP